MGRVVYFVVGDDGLNAGDGIKVKSLEEMKQKLSAMKREGDWTLVISMHGNVDVIASTVNGVIHPDQPDKDDRIYRQSDIESLFGKDQKFAAWKEKYGPSRVTLNSCQVEKPLEGAILSGLKKSKASQGSQGLGLGCQPLTTTKTYVSSKDVEIRTRAQWGALSDSEKKDFKATLAELNRKFGYFGASPVPETELLDYYFDEPPKGGWPVITIRAKGADTGISFYNRAQNVKFLTEVCTQHMGSGRTHTPRVPAVGDE